VSWGDGKLTFQGKDHIFNVNGLSVIDLGVSKVTANGEVFNLKKLSDFNGNYVAGTAGATVGGGAGAVIMKNQNGVVLKLTSTSQGVQLTLAGRSRRQAQELISWGPRNGPIPPTLRARQSQ
jgi:hypothetical protein